MDLVFYLGREARGRFLRSTARAARCVYICLWSYQPHPSNCLVSVDGWLNEEENERYCSGDVIGRHFDAYRKSFCSMESGVPGLAFKTGKYLELQDSDLASWAATMPVQQQFYKEAGIKTAVFMGCKSGEIELGMSSSGNTTNIQRNIRSFFTDDNVQRFQQAGDGSAQPEQSRPSSSSSSLRSLSVGSPESSSFFLGGVRTPSPFDPYKEVVAVLEQQPLIQPTITTPLPQPSLQVTNYSRPVLLPRAGQFPSTASDDAAMMRAMLAVISSTSAAIDPSRGAHREDRNQASTSGGGRTGAFKAYALAPRIGSRTKVAGGQSMIKRLHSIMGSLHSVRLEEAAAQEARAPTSNQLHHMISERKRREKLNDSFQALRSLLPPGTKKDKASVLSATRTCLTDLRSQISNLEEKNRLLKQHLLLPEDDCRREKGPPPESSGERVSVRVVQAAGRSTPQLIELVVTVKAECDVVDLLIRVLECLKEMGKTSLVSVDADASGPLRRASLKLQVVEGTDWDEETFGEEISRAVDEATLPQGTAGSAA